MGGILSASTTMLGALLRPFLDFVFPPACLCCKRILEASQEHLCGECWSSIPRITRSHFLYCDTREKLLFTGAVSDLLSCFVFEKEGAFQVLAHALKYEGFESVGIELGRQLGRSLMEWKLAGDVLIPVPLHRLKQRERGFNQAACIALGMADVTGIHVETNLLLRSRYTHTQTKLSIGQRKKNMENAFVLRTRAEPAVAGKTCIVVDDVITTGATLGACAEVLIEAGATRVIAASAALAE